MDGQPNIAAAFTKFRRLTGSNDGSITKEQFRTVPNKLKVAFFNVGVGRKNHFRYTGVGNDKVGNERNCCCVGRNVGIVGQNWIGPVRMTICEPTSCIFLTTDGLFVAACSLAFAGFAKGVVGDYSAQASLKAATDHLRIQGIAHVR